MARKRCARLWAVLCLAPAALLLSAADAEAQCGTRFVAPGGTDAANACLTAGAPCATITHASGLACDGDTVSVAEGTYVEDVVVARRVRLNSSGANANTILRGTGAGDAVRLLASGIAFNGFTVTGNTVAACVRVGDAAHPNVRGVEVTNSTLSGCAAGLVIDSPGNAGEWIRINGNSISGQVAGAGPLGGIGILLTGGAGRVDVKQNTIADNHGPALRVEAAAAVNRTIVVVGNVIRNNGRGPAGAGRTGIEARGVADLRIEGNTISGHTGLAGVLDGQAVLLDGADGVNFFCNLVRDNDSGVELAGGTANAALLHGRFAGHAGTAVLVRAGALAGVVVNENVFAGNAVAIHNEDAQALDGRHNWRGAPGGPLEAVVGPVDLSNEIASATEPVLARAATDVGWSSGTAACFDRLQPALDAAPAGGLVLVGAGSLPGRAVLDGKPLTIEGLYNGPYPICSPSVIDGTQTGGTRVPNLRLRNVAGVRLRNLTLRGAGLGVPCFGGHTDEEIGLDLQNVDDSTFRGLCVNQNGTTEVRVYGDSDGNVFEDVHLSGMIRDIEGDDLCGHRAREGFFIDGGPACEGGPGAIADGNRLFDVTTFHVSRSVRLRLARGTEIGESLIHGVPSAEWDGGDFSVGIWVFASDDTYIHDNREIGNRGMIEAIRVQGVPAGSCITEELHSEGTRIENNTISLVEQGGVGIHLVRADGDPGLPLRTSVRCTTVRDGFIGVHARHAGSGADANVLEACEIDGNAQGVRNDSADVLAATGGWWGDPSGPSGAGPGAGDSISPGVDAAGFVPTPTRTDDDGDGFTECAGDADDTDPLVNPLDRCDGLDNDLDGTLDEDFAPAATACGVGACARSGVTSCSAGTVVDSCLAGEPLGTTDALCDGVDDDCDGATDEDYLAEPTTCGSGGCARSGALACVGGVVQDTCVPGTPAADDTLCNGLDDDCDGPVDEEFAPHTTACGLGVCAAAGTATCVAGVLDDTCEPGPPAAPQDTLCNALDDDCDGAADEDYGVVAISCGVGACARAGTSVCVDGTTRDECTTGPPLAPEDLSCDGVDDDCDGTSDEEFEDTTTSCGRGLCVAVGLLTCADGRLADSCVPGTPGVEACNQVDDDCDGTVDDVLPPGAAQGLSVTTLPGIVRVSWDTEASADGYDLVRGSLSTLRASGGDFAAATQSCLADDLAGTSYDDGESSPTAGDGAWYLLRAVNCAGIGSYDLGAGLAGPRDAEIAASGAACP